MSLVLFPSTVVIHRPNGEDLLLRDRLVSASGSYGLKLGSHQFRTGSAQLQLSNYDDLIDPSGENLTLQELQESTVTIGVGAHSVFYGRVRSARSRSLLRRTDVVLSLHDALADLSGGQEVTIPVREWPEQSGNRLNAILDAFGWPGSSAYRAVDNGVVFCQPTNPDENGVPRDQSGKVIDLLRQVAATEWARLGVAHGRPLRDRVYNRGRLVFDGRSPLPPPDIHIDNASAALAAGSLRPSSPLVSAPDKADLINMVRLQAASTAEGQEGVMVVASDTDSVDRYGAQEYAPRSPVLSNPTDAQGLAVWLLEVYARPRSTFRDVRLSPYLTGNRELCERVYRLSVDKSVQVSNIQADDDFPQTSIHRVDFVRFEIRPGDNNAVDADGNFAGGCLMDLTLDLQIPEASAFWSLGQRGASELGSTTLLAPPQPDDDNIRVDVAPAPFVWEDRRLVSAVEWNANLVNKSVFVYDSEADREHRRSKGAFAAGQAVPSDGQITVLANRLWIQAWNAESGQDQTLARVESRESPSALRLDATTGTAGRLDYGNLLSGGEG